MDETGPHPTVEATAAALTAAGYRHRDPPARGLALLDPPDPTDASSADPLPGLRVRAPTPFGGGGRPLEVTPTSGDPVEVVTALGNALDRDRDVLFVPEGPDRERSADRTVEVLADPVGAKAVDADGHRTFYPGADRVHLAEGGLAAVGTDDLGPGPARSVEFEWFEEADDDPAGDRAGSDGAGHGRDPGTGSGPDPDGRTGSDRAPRLVLEADGHPVAVVGSVAELSCPGPDRAAVPFYYRRGEDRLFHVFRSDGSPVGVFDGVRRMRRQGFVPVPAPLVPERELSSPPGGRWAVVTGVDDPR